jgi:hypothetical protein
VAHIDTLRLLLMAEVPNELDAIEMVMRAITQRIGELEPGTDVYEAAHARLDTLLAARERLTVQAH